MTDQRSRPARIGLLAAAAALYVTGTIGSNIAPAWLDDHPAIVLLLSSRNRNLFASVGFIDPVPYALIGFTRLLVVGVVLYGVGAWFGSTAISWTERQVGEMPALYRWFEAGMRRAGWAFVLLMPGSNLVCLMAGHRRMPVGRFVALLSVGIALKLVALRIGGDIFKDEVSSLLEWIESYQWWIVGGLFAISALQSARKANRNPPTELVEAATADEGEEPGGTVA